MSTAPCDFEIPMLEGRGRPSRKRHCLRYAEAQSMPEGPAERGVEATRARLVRARHAESMDGAEHKR